VPAGMRRRTRGLTCDRSFIARSIDRPERCEIWIAGKQGFQTPAGGGNVLQCLPVARVG